MQKIIKELHKRNLSAIAHKLSRTIANQIDDTIESYIDEIKSKFKVPDGQWGNIKTILAFLVGNKLDFISRSFVDNLINKRLNEFYIDTRVKTKPVQNNWSNGKVGMREFKQAFNDLKKSI